MRKVITSVLLSVVCATTHAQSGTNSPYSQYGLGAISEQSGGFNRGMNGLALGFREHNQVNYLNPASYSAIDSLSFIFDVGASAQFTRFKEGGKSLNTRNADFEYAVAGLRLAKGLGLSFGFIPYSKMGYGYADTRLIRREDDGSTSSYTTAYSGEGGLRQAYLGLGWQFVKGLSVGVNASYMWGSYERGVINRYNDATVNTLSKYYKADFGSLHFGVGLQYTQALGAKDALTLGASYQFGHDSGANPLCQVISRNSQTAIADTASYNAGKGLKVPSLLSAGFLWNHEGRWKVGADYSLQRWSAVQMPVYEVNNNVASYTFRGNLFDDRHKFTVGGEFCPNENSRRFFSRIRYRVGASYASSYLKISNINGPKEYSLSAGLGIPIINSYNTRSFLNISAQWVNQSSQTFVKENTFRINIGLTFNERWFAKWKVE